MSSTKSPLAAIVTGMEHSGTSHLANLIKCHSRIRGGFECGVLRAKNPCDLPTLSPFFDWLKLQGDRQWGLSEDQAERLARSSGWDEVYRRICEFSPLFRPGDLLLDKCPAYTSELKAVLNKVNSPCFVTIKTTVAQYASFKKRGFKLDKFIAHYLAYTTGLLAALPDHLDKITIIWHDDLVERPLTILADVFQKIGLDLPHAEIESHLANNSNLHSQPRLGSFEYQEPEKIGRSFDPDELASISLVSLDEKLAALTRTLNGPLDAHSEHRELKSR